MSRTIDSPRLSTPRGRRDVVGSVYVIKLAKPIGNPAKAKGRAMFYVGWTERDPKQRLAEHRGGVGSKMLRAAAERGIRFKLLLTLPGTRRLERAIKDAHNTPRLVKQWKARGILA